MIALLIMCLDGNNQITQTLAITQLTKHQRKELVPTCEVLHIVVTFILNLQCDGTGHSPETQPIERRRILICSYAVIHFDCKGTKSNPCTRKISVTNYISIISKNA